MCPDVIIKKKGFTLIEVLVAVMVLSILMLMLFASFQSFLASSERLDGKERADRVATPALEQLEKDLEALFVLPEPRFMPEGPDDMPDPSRLIGKETTVNGQVFSRLGFASLNHVFFGPDKRNGVARMVYYIRTDEGGRFLLCRSDRLGETGDDTRPCTDPVLMTNVTVFDCRFVDGEGNEHQYWDSGSDEFEYDLPRYIRVRIGFLEGEEERLVETSVAVPVSRRRV